MSLPMLSRYARRLLQQAVEHHSDEEQHHSDEHEEHHGDEHDEEQHHEDEGHADEHHSDEHHSDEHHSDYHLGMEHYSDYDGHGEYDENTLDVRIIAIFAILVAGIIGALVPLFFKVRGVGA